MRILVAYGSKRGGTAGLAQMLADAFAHEGVTAEVWPAARVADVRPYDAVIVGGSLYLDRWHRDARRFVRRHTAVLRERPVFMFSSGPLDDRATEGDVPPTKGVRRLMDRVHAREHVTFGGRLDAHARGFPASAMAKEQSGDWRDPAQVRAWAHHIVGSVTGGVTTPKRAGSEIVDQR